MDPIGIPQLVTISAPALPAAPAQNAPSITLPDPSAAVPPDGIPDQVSYNAQVAEQNRVTAIQHTAQQIANVYVIGDQTFSLFKDVTGQYITRFTSLRDGKVTYIPEPTLFKLGSSTGNDTAPLVKIQT